MKRQSENNKSSLKLVDTIQAFKMDRNDAAPIYFDANTIPPFLINNLKSQHRVIKEFTGPDAIIKAFYFNLMKLSFQLESEEQNYGQIIKNALVGQQQFGEGQLQDKNLTDAQYRKFLSEFFEILQNQQIPNFEQTIQYYPIVDQILMKMFKKMVPVTLFIKDCSDFDIAKRTLEFLSAKFKIKLQIISGCFKFIESDMFAYIQSLKKIYIVYVDQLAFIKEVTQYASSQALNHQQSMSNSQQLTKKLMNGSKVSNVKSQSKSDVKKVSHQPISQSEKRAFTTVINMLESKKSVSAHSNFSSSIKCRNSFESQLGDPYHQKTGEDKIAERQKSLAEEYYGENSQLMKKTPFNVSSVSSVKYQKSVKSNKETQNYPLNKQELEKQPHSIAQITIKDKTSNIKSSQFSNKLSNPSISHTSVADPPQIIAKDNLSNLNSSSFSNHPTKNGIVIDSPLNSVKEKESKINLSQISHQTSSHQTSYTSVINPPSVAPKTISQNKSIIRSKQSMSIISEKPQLISEPKIQQKQKVSSKPHIDMTKKQSVEPYTISKQLSQLTSKNGHLQIFSNIEEKLMWKEPKKQKFQDKSYQKFTDSKLLQILDEQFKTKIKTIKQKYRQVRPKIKHLI